MGCTACTEPRCLYKGALYLLLFFTTNPGSQVAVATEFRMVAPNTCGPSVWNLLHIIILVPKVLR